MDSNKPKAVKFIYKKTPNYNTYNVDGIFGGITTKNKIFIEFFSEKFDIPEFVVQEILDDGNLGKEMSKKQSDAILREIECGVYIDVPTAKAFVDWLIKKIDELEKLNKKAK